MKFDFFTRKKFKCLKCDEKFKIETELRQHSKIDHGGKRIAYFLMVYYMTGLYTRLYMSVVYLNEC